MTTAAVSPIASSTAQNWLKEAQESLAASENPGGMMGALQNARGNGSVKSFLATSQTISNAFSLISSSTAEAAFNLAAQMGSQAAHQRASDRLAAVLAQNRQQTNYTPSEGLAPVIYFEDGSSLDTVGNIFTMADGKKIDSTTGQKYIAPGSLIQMANGSYLDTVNNILTMSDGTKIDTVTGLTVTA